MSGSTKKSHTKKRNTKQEQNNNHKINNPPGLRDIPFQLPKVTAEEKRRARRLLSALEKEYPDAHCELDFSNPHELLIATILSAQCTDVAVNKATPDLFKRFPTPKDYAQAQPTEIEPYIKSLGFYRNKAKSIHLSMKDIVAKHNDQVPKNMDDLLNLHGVARKTANVVLGNAFGINMGVVVDTHVQRLSWRLGLVEQDTTPTMIERKLMALMPRDKWCLLSHLLIWHGRRVCKARAPQCAQHPICQKFGINCELRNLPKTAKGQSSRKTSSKRTK